MQSLDTVLEGASYEGLERVVINDDKEKFFQVGAQFPPQEKEELMVFLKRNIDVFVWNAYEAPIPYLSSSKCQPGSYPQEAIASALI